MSHKPGSIRHPGKQAAKVRHLEQHARAARARGSDEYADQLERQASTIAERLNGAGRCSRCGRELSDPRSVQRGIGPECVKRQEAGE